MKVQSLSLQERAMTVVLALVSASVVPTSAIHAGQGASQEISVDDPRPLSGVLEALEKRHGWIITYEDPPYDFAGDVVDLTRTVRKDFDSSKPKVLVPRGGPFTFTYVSADPPRQPEPHSVLQTLVGAYKASGHPGEFRLLQTGTTFHVLPAMSANAEGHPQQRGSRLDVRITIEDGERSALEQLEMIVRATSRALNNDMSLGIVPMNMLIGTRVHGGATNEEARSLLMRSLAATGRTLSWQLFCEPAPSRRCALNLHAVEPLSR